MATSEPGSASWRGAGLLQWLVGLAASSPQSGPPPPTPRDRVLAAVQQDGLQLARAPVDREEGIAGGGDAFFGSALTTLPSKAA